MHHIVTAFFVVKGIMPYMCITTLDETLCNYIAPIPENCIQLPYDIGWTKYKCENQNVVIAP